MNKKYDMQLVKKAKKKKEVMSEYRGVPLLVKNLPDCNEKRCNGSTLVS